MVIGDWIVKSSVTGIEKTAPILEKLMSSSSDIIPGLEAPKYGIGKSGNTLNYVFGQNLLSESGHLNSNADPVISSAFSFLTSIL